MEVLIVIPVTPHRSTTWVTIYPIYYYKYFSVKSIWLYHRHEDYAKFSKKKSPTPHLWKIALPSSFTFFSLPSSLSMPPIVFTLCCMSVVCLLYVCNYVSHFPPIFTLFYLYFIFYPLFYVLWWKSNHSNKATKTFCFIISNP